jgi:hypothetical protein
MKNKQLILMILSLSLIVIFFLPWISIQKGFDMFAESGGGYSGFSLVSGIHFAAPMVSSFGSAYGFPFASKLIYLGYILWLIPLLGVAAILMSGMRVKHAGGMHVAQFVLTLVLVLLAVVGVNFNEDIRTLYQSILSTTFIFWIMVVVSIAGIAVSVAGRKSN